MRFPFLGYAALVSVALAQSRSALVWPRNATKLSSGDGLTEVVFLSNETRPHSSPEESSDRAAAFYRVQTDWQLPEGTCNEQIPCANGACCSKVSRTCDAIKLDSLLIFHRLLNCAATLQRSAVLTASPTAMPKQNAASTAHPGSKSAH